MTAILIGLGIVAIIVAIGLCWLWAVLSIDERPYD